VACFNLDTILTLSPSPSPRFLSRFVCVILAGAHLSF